MDKEVDKRIDEGLLCGSAMWRGWIMIGLLREPMWESMLVVAELIGHGRYQLIP